MKTLDFALDVKSVDDAGVFEGYASVFGNVDSHGDKVMPGAFGESLARHKRQGSKPVVLWQHNAAEPIGVAEDIAEDGKGLYTKTRLVLETARGREAHALLKAGAIRGLSIGYRVNESKPDGNTLQLTKLDLIEYSVVSFPANTRANVESVKSYDRLHDFARRLRDGEPMPVKDFEDILREAGVPKSMATDIASVGYAKAIRSESGGKANSDAILLLQEAIATFRS